MTSPDGAPNPGRVEQTRPRTLAVAAIIGGLAGWLLVVVSDALDLTAPLVPWTAPLALVVIAVLIIVLARSTHQRVQVRRERMEVNRAVGYLVLGKASALVGALVAGGYLTFALSFATRLDAEAPRDRVVRSAVAVLGGAALMVGGLLLERACKVPRDPEDEESSDARRS